jgi:5-methylcytosine-specific restriction endonuclease McrA
MIDARRRKSVRARAGERCEYCRLPEWALPLAAFHVEHITARVHGGGDGLVNLALACHHCNAHKGPNLSGIDPTTKELVRLFHPRRDRWEEHFHWRGPRLIGRTSIGRTTIRTLAMNHAELIAIRRALIAEGVFPPA